MPHDRDGNVLEPGDFVVVRCVVNSITTGEEFCNLTLESIEGRKPDGYKETLCINANVVEKIHK